MNTAVLIGRLTGDPELRTTQSGKFMTRFTVAVDRPVKSGEEKQADFITVCAWGQRAEMLCKYFSKGNKIGITGSIRTGSYTDKDGIKRYTFEVWAEGVDFCESRGTTQSAQPQQQSRPSNSNGQRQQPQQQSRPSNGGQRQQPPQPHYDDEEYVINDGDLPF